MSRPDVIVVGAGVIGCAIARSLVARGIATTVVDRDPPGTHASWAAAGMLAPLVEADQENHFLSLLRASARLFPALVAELHAETGIDVAYAADGTLLLALTPRDEAELAERFLWQSRSGLPVERLSASEARRREPSISAAVRLALRFADDTQVDNRLLSEALARAAERAGARFQRGEVERLVVKGGSVTGVALTDGDRLDGAAVVIAAGCWSGRLGGLPRELPVRPIHGQLIALDAPPGLLRHVVDTPRAYMVPRRDGRIIVGTTMEDTGFRKAVTHDAVARLRAAAAEAVPGVAKATLVESWSGLRPGTPDGLPILGSDPEVQGLFYATGHFRNGILLTPITARAMTDLISGAPVELELAPFSIERFT